MEILPTKEIIINLLNEYQVVETNADNHKLWVAIQHLLNVCALQQKEIDELKNMINKV